MLTQQQIEAIILYHLYGESEAAAKRFRDAVSEAAKEIAAKQGGQADICPKCGGENGKHKLDCQVAHNMLADNASR